SCTRWRWAALSATSNEARGKSQKVPESRPLSEHRSLLLQQRYTAAVPRCLVGRLWLPRFGRCQTVIGRICLENPIPWCKSCSRTGPIRCSRAPDHDPDPLSNQERFSQSTPEHPDCAEHQLLSAAADNHDEPLV